MNPARKESIVVTNCGIIIGDFFEVKFNDPGRDTMPGDLEGVTKTQTPKTQTP